MKTSIILVGAGRGERFGKAKLFAKLAGKTLLELNLNTINSLKFEKEMILVVNTDDIENCEQVLNSYPDLKELKIISGGKERFESVKLGLENSTGDLIIIHNVANPLASVEDFQVIHDAIKGDNVAAFVGQKIVDTLRRLEGDKSITIDRNNVWRVQTPQGFRKESLLKVIDLNKDEEVTDEIMLFDDSEIPVQAFESSLRNQKITYPSDLDFMESFFDTECLTGIGEDSHAFDEEGELILAGIKIEGFPKLKGNSDGDLILHALFNAISSALGEGSLGPTADPLCEQGNSDSTEYLKVILEKMKSKGFKLSNLSISLECQKPKIDPLTEVLKHNLSKLLNLDISKIGITATSGEGLTSFGKGKGIRASCSVLLKKL